VWSGPETIVGTRVFAAHSMQPAYGSWCCTKLANKVDPRSRSPNAVAAGLEETRSVLESAEMYGFLCLHVLEGAGPHHVARCDGARAGRCVHPRNLLVRVSDTPPASGTSPAGVATCRGRLLEGVF
jgi:hypothetical protein